MERKTEDKASHSSSASAPPAVPTMNTTTAGGAHTAEQQQKIVALQQLMHDHFNPLPPQLLFFQQTLPYHHSDTDTNNERDPEWFYCTCFLVSREWDVQRALVMMQEVVAYRAANHLDERSQLPPAVSVRGWNTDDVGAALIKDPRKAPDRVDRIVAGVAQNLACGIHFWDKGGRPVVYVMIDSLDEPGLIKKLKENAKIGQKPADVLWEYGQHFIGVGEELVLYQLQQQQQQQQQQHEREQLNAEETAAEAGSRPSGYTKGVITLVMDLKGLHMGLLWKPMVDLFRDVTRQLFKYYPDMVHKIIAVNAPGIVRVAFNMVKGVMPVDFQKKISFVSPHNSLAALEEEIAVEHIPVFLGGRCSCAEKSENGANEKKGMSGSRDSYCCVDGYDRSDPLRRKARKTQRGKRDGDAETIGANNGIHAKGNEGEGDTEGSEEAAAATEDVNLSAGQRHTRLMTLKKSETVVWEFSVSHDGADVTFTVFFVPTSSSSAATVNSMIAAAKGEGSKLDTGKLEPYRLPDCEDTRCADAYTAAEDGTVVLSWRNTRSWLATRSVQLRVYKDCDVQPDEQGDS